MADRKAELERKKARLAQIREEKKRKEEERKRREQVEEAAKASKKGPDPSEIERKRIETEQLLKDIGIEEQKRAQAAVPSMVAAEPPGVTQKKAQPSADDRPLPTLARKSLKLSLTDTSVINIPPREKVAYSKETQTIVEVQEKEESEEEIEPPPEVEEPPPDKKEDEEKEEEAQRPRELTEEEKQQIVLSDDFQTFINNTSRVMERALAEDMDIFYDYGGQDLEEREGPEAGAKMSLQRQFNDERWSRYRTVTYLDWSAQYPELLVASYNNNEESPNEPDGVCLVWNMKFKKTTPEYIFHCQSPVMAATYAKFHPNLVVGGTYSGQIVLWDNRSNKRTPVQRTPLSAAAHTHPVYCVDVVGTQNAHNLITVSTDGKMCSWSLDMLSNPQESMELQHKQSKAVAVTCMSFPPNDVNNFVVGSEEMAVYTGCRHGSKAGINEIFEGHQGPVTSIDCHPATGQVDFSHLFLTSSFDWTVKLWSVKHQRPLYSFEDNSDYVYDARWSPIHPAVFATGDGMGRLDVWNLNNDSEVPTASVTLDMQPAINRVRWHSSGHQVACGDADGKVWIYDIGEQIAVPRTDEWQKFVRTLSDMRANMVDSQDEGGLSSGRTSMSSSPLR
ncbi:DYNC1I2 [Branchiostoma lanceolatum]|nr:DYNC1I2 [Branchiostoma lanceolatum]